MAAKFARGKILRTAGPLVLPHAHKARHCPPTSPPLKPPAWVQCLHIDRPLVQHPPTGFGWTVLDTQRSLWVQTKTAHHDPWRRRCFAPQGALTRPRLSRFALHFSQPNGYLDSGFLV